MRTSRPPTAPDFDLDRFRKLIPEIAGDNIYLALTAMYLCAETTAWRKHQAENSLPAISAKTASLLAAAMLNREFMLRPAV